MLENRQAMKRTSRPLRALRRARIDQYPRSCCGAHLRRSAGGQPTVVLLTPGAQLRLLRALLPRRRWGSSSSRAATSSATRLRLHAHDARARTGRRDLPRIDDDFLDPLIFRATPSSARGLLNAYRAGNVTLANAPGRGRRRQGVYAYVPEMIRFYLGEEPLLPNVPTYLAARRGGRAYIPPTSASRRQGGRRERGHGMLIGPQSTRAQRESFRARIAASRATSSPSRRSDSAATRSSRRAPSRPRRPAPFVSTAAASRSSPAG